MSARIFRLRIEQDWAEPDPLDDDEVSCLVLEAEALVSNGLPDGWYAKIEENLDEQASP